MTSPLSLSTSFIITALFLNVVFADPWGDFKEIANEYARIMGEGLKQKVHWVDCYGEHNHIKENQEYLDLMAQAEIVGDVTYAEFGRTRNKPGWLFSNWYHNSLSTVLTAKFHETKEVEDVFSWSVEANLKFSKDNLKKNFTFIIPPQLGLDMKNYTKEFDADEVLFGVQAEKKVVKTDEFTIEQVVNIPPHKSVHAKMTIKELESSMPWYAEIKITGHIAVWYKKKVDGHHLWFYPVSHLAHLDPRFEATNDGLIYRVTGHFEGVFSTHATLELIELGMNWG